MAQDGTYPPLDVPKPVAESVWVVDGGPQRVFGLHVVQHEDETVISR